MNAALAAIEVRFQLKKFCWGDVVITLNNINLFKVLYFFEKFRMLIFIGK